MKLKGKVAFVTGFGSGLGQAIAVMFAQGRRRGCGDFADGGEGLRDGRGDRKGRRQGALLAPAMSAEFGADESLIDDTVAQFGGIDIVVNSAGVRTNGSITEITEEDWDRTLDMNLKGRVHRLASGDPRDEKARRRRDPAISRRAPACSANRGGRRIAPPKAAW